MSRREDLLQAKQIALIRTLQLERQRLKSQRAAANVANARAMELSASTTMETHIQTLRRVLQSASGFAPEFASQVGACVDAADQRLALAKLDTKQASDCDHSERQAYARSQQLADVAKDMLARETLADARTREQRETDAIEENLWARGASS
jgi:hypothetical protein